MKKIIIASDSFKGCLSSREVGEACREAIRSLLPGSEVIVVEVGDGGEGTASALQKAWGGSYIPCEAVDPLWRGIHASYLLSDKGGSAYIELAASSGLTLLTPQERDPTVTTTYGTGMMIADALRRGCRDIFIGLGGSATNDAATGLLSALGFRFLDSRGLPVKGVGESLAVIASVDESDVMQEVREAVFHAVCDVRNPFAGPDGAACVFAPQKGASPEMVARLDDGLRNFAANVRRCGYPFSEDLPGGGAAGGVGGSLHALLRADLIPGIEMILDAVDFDDMLRGADLVITGEGRMDAQTLGGKAPAGVLRRALRGGVPVVGICGRLEDEDELRKAGFHDLLQVTPADISLAEYMRPEVAASNIRRTLRTYLKTTMNPAGS